LYVRECLWNWERKLSGKQGRREGCNPRGGDDGSHGLPLHTSVRA